MFSVVVRWDRAGPVRAFDLPGDADRLAGRGVRHVVAVDLAAVAVPLHAVQRRLHDAGDLDRH